VTAPDVSRTLAKLEEAKRTGNFNVFVDYIPYMRFLGVQVETKDGALVGRMPAADHLIGNPSIPALHGGTLGALLEAASQFELLWRAETVVLPKTITITIDYLRSGKPQDTFVKASIVKQGRRVTTVQAKAWQEDENQPIATATVILLILGVG
jgi:uncharacterized protein (TIGR00369 family)